MRLDASTSALLVVIDDATGVQLVQEDVHVALLGGAGQHEPVPTLLDGHEQVARARQRRHLLKERVDFLALFLPGLIAYPALQALTADRRDHLVPAHADQPVQPPHRIGLPTERRARYQASAC